MTKDYETIDAGQVDIGDFLRQKVWNIERRCTDYAFLKVVAVDDGPTSRWITMARPEGFGGRYGTGTTRIRPRRTTKVQRRVRIGT